MTHSGQILRGLHVRFCQIVLGPQLFAFVPAAALIAYWIGGEPVLMAVALCAPVLLLLVRPTQNEPSVQPVAARDHISRSGLEAQADQSIQRATTANLSTAIYLIEVDGTDGSGQRIGPASVDFFQSLTMNRLRHLCKTEDDVFRLSENRFAIVLAPCLKLDLETMMEQANRLQAGLEEPAPLEYGTYHAPVSIGLCPNTKIAACTGQKLLDAAESALNDAISNGPSAIRLWSPSIDDARGARETLLNDVQRAISNGQIQPWFQPQICTSTGKITGMEALARWIHPERGVVPPGEFLHCFEQTGLIERLSEAMFHQSLSSLQEWDRAGIDIPRVSVNFAASELRNPHLIERLKWELDRFDIPANRLGVEILETVIADTPKGITVRNITELGQMGCLIDLDDFGTGHASMATLRRFKVHRLKIDRSFVSRIDRDQEQRRMFAAVLSLAEQLGLETLAEGVETAGEHALLSQLGCDHVQGFGIGRPMPAGQVAAWVQKHAAHILSTQWQGRDLG